MTAERGPTTRTARSHVAGWLALALLAERLRRRAAESTAGRGEARPRGGRDGDGSGQARPCGTAQGARAGTGLAAAFIRCQGTARSLRAHRARQRQAGVVDHDVQAHRSDWEPPPLALVEASDGIGYILKPGDTLGDGRVTEITQSAVTFAVAAKSGQAATTATLRLAQD